MRVMIDTNVFISAALFPKGSAAAAMHKALTPPYEPVVCDYIVDELHRKFQEKFPEHIVDLEAFLYTALPAFEVVPTPEDEIEAETRIRDLKDRPIIRSAINAGVELFLTGDKDFLESSVNKPCIISVREFLEM